MSIKLNDKARSQYVKGLEYIYPQMTGKWAECVRERNCTTYKGVDVDIALDFMCGLKKNASLWNIYRECENKYSIFENAFGSAVNIVTKFSRNGVEFYSWVIGHVYAKVPTLREEKYICRLARHNSDLEKNSVYYGEDEDCL